MGVKASGAELKAFYNDVVFWPPGEGNTWHEDESVTVNNQTWEGEYTDVPDNAQVVIDGGIVFSTKWEEGDAPSFETYFKRWRKAQSTAFLSVECPKDKEAAVRAAIKAAGGKVV